MSRNKVVNDYLLARRRASSVANTLLGGGFSGFSGFSGFGGFGGSSGSGGSGSGLVVISRNSSSLMFRSLSSLSRFTKAAKYVLILLVAFTLAWMPWIVLLCRDILLHGTGYWEDELRRYGCFVPLPQEGSTMRYPLSGWGRWGLPKSKTHFWACHTARDMCAHIVMIGSRWL